MLWAGVATLFVIIVGVAVLLVNLFGSPAAPPQQQLTLPPDFGFGWTEEEEEADDVDRLPHEVVTDLGVRQALELIFRREISQITWEEIHEIQTLYIHTRPNSDVDTVIMSTEVIPLAELEGNPLATEVQTDSVRRDRTELTDSLRAFENLHVLYISVEVPQSTLEHLPYLQELSVLAGRSTPDLTTFSVLPNLQRLTIAGGNFESLQGISELNNLYSLSLQSTGIRDLSVLGQQQNVTELSFVRNRELSSLGTLQDMTWLRSFHLERSDTEINLQFLGNLTSLESLRLIHTDTRTYDFILPLTNLRHLTLYRNDAVLEIPSLSGFGQLEELFLEVRRQTGVEELATSLRDLTSLRRLSLRGLDSLEPIRGMEYLEELNVQVGGRLTDVAPLGTLTNLHTLRMPNGSGYMQNMNAIGQLSALRVLEIPAETRSGMLFNWDFIYGLIGLEELHISGNLVVGNFADIRNLENLRVLRINDIRVIPGFRRTSSGGVSHVYYDADPVTIEQFAESLGALVSLEELHIADNRLQDISFVGNLQNLRYLNAQSNYIADVSPLAELSELAYANLRRNPIANWDAVAEMINTTFVGRG